MARPLSAAFDGAGRFRARAAVLLIAGRARDDAFGLHGGDVELILIGCLGLVAVLQHRKLNELTGQYLSLRNRIEFLLERPAPVAPAAQAAPVVAVAPVVEAPDAPPEPAPVEPVVPATPPGLAANEEQPLAPEAPPAPEQVAPEAGPPPRPTTARAPSLDLERLLGVNLPVWGGAAMLVIAGFFVVNWALETGFFTPGLRVALCGLAALALLAAAVAVRLLRIANGERIASALATAAIATAYATAYLAAPVFGLISGGAAFWGAVVITAAAIGIALAFGQTVMAVGLIGGYLAPFFIDGGSVEPIALYFTVLLTGSLAVVRIKGWWTIGMLALIPPALWAALLQFDTTGTAAPAAFLFALAAIPALAVHLPVAGAPIPAAGRRIADIGCGAASLGFLAAALLEHFNTPELISVVGFCAIASGLSAWRPAEHRISGALSLIVAAAFLGLWSGFEPPHYLVFALALVAVIETPLLWQLLRGRHSPARAAEVTGVLAAAFVTLMVKLDGWGGARDLPHLWASIALALALVFALASWRYYRTDPESRTDAAFAVGSSSFISLALGLVLDPGLYALTAALQVLGLSLVFAVYRTVTVRVMAIVYAWLYVVLLLVGQGAGVRHELLAMSWLETYLPDVAFSDAPVPLLVIPALALLAAATVFARFTYDTLVRCLEWGGVAALALGIHFLAAPRWPVQLPFDAFTRGWPWYIAMSALALAVVFAGVLLRRPSLRDAGAALGAVTLGVIGVFAIVPVYRLWPTIATPGAPFVNLAMLALGAPALLLLGIAPLLRHDGAGWAAKGFAAAAGAIGFTLVLVLIRQFYHGDTLNGPGLGSGELELYSYSAGMLVYGFALLGVGAWQSSQALRFGSLIVVLLTVGKVFLYDASGLDGLWRAGSFLGLGVALLAVSWFFARFVFRLSPRGRRRTETAAA